MAVAIGTVQAEYTLQELHHYSIRLLHLHLFVTLGAGKVLCSLVLLIDISLQLRELDEAIVASTSRAFRTLQDIGYHEHTHGALKVFGLDAQSSVHVEILLGDSILLFVRLRLHHFLKYLL